MSINTVPLWGFTIVNDEVDKWDMPIEDFCTVFNSSESLASDSVAGESSYIFNNIDERDRQADLWSQRLYEKSVDKADDLMDEYRERGLSPSDFFRQE
tara:strand:+ start:190 stop:483 length:294 start_codon:yes stop_codon:yes gene_type:complete